jgi:hypothetical protein
MTERAMFPQEPRRPEAGFTLVESLVAIIVLVFGLIAVTNLLLVGASSNMVANQGTAAAVSASKVLEALRRVPFTDLVPVADQGNLDRTNANEATAAASCDTVVLPTAFACFDDIEGVGRIYTRWRIEAVPGTARALHIHILSEGLGALSRSRSRAEFTVLRTCTDSTTGPAGALVPPCPVGP